MARLVPYVLMAAVLWGIGPQVGEAMEKQKHEFCLELEVTTHRALDCAP